MTATSPLCAALILTCETPVMKTPINSPRRSEVQRTLALADPAPDCGIAVEVKTTLVRQPRIGEQRDIGEADAVADKIARRCELVLHPRQRGIAALDLVRIEVGGGLS